MWPSLLCAALLLLGAGAAWQTAVLGRRRRALAQRLACAAIQQQEARRAQRSRQQLADAAATAAAVVNAGNLTVQTAHQMIAAIPFGILEAIPVTRDTTRVVRAVHDGIAGLVYGAIAAASRGAEVASRRG